jgi:hypothetical protein
MNKLIVTYANLFGAIGAGFRAPKVLALMSVTALIACSGALVMGQLEDWRFTDALYFSIVSMATVGYGDFSPKTGLGKMFTIGFLFVGIGVFVLTVSTLAEAILREFHKREQPPGDKG